MPTNEYMREYMKRRYQERRAIALKTLGEQCAKCESKEELEVDHIDPSTKTMNFTHMRSVSLRAFHVELSKCQLLCRTCHEAKTRIDLGRTPKGAHGTIATYRFGGCRCDACKKAHNAYQAAWRKAKRARAREGDLAHTRAEHPKVIWREGA